MSSIPSDAATIQLSGIGVSFAKKPDTERDWIVRGLDLEVKEGEFVVIVGPSGCGKSTLLRIIAGIENAREGEVTTYGQKVTGPGPDRGMVFQSVDTPLFEWLTVRQNIEFGLRVKHLERAAVREITDKHLSMVGLQDHAAKFPGELSGGMKQRTQIARVLAASSDVILFDEPCAALDAQTKRILQKQIASIWAKQNKTFVYVTHDINEAVLLGQRVLVMSAAPQSHFVRTHEIDLPYPRDPFDSAFVEHARMIQSDIETEVQKVWV